MFSAYLVRGGCGGCNEPVTRVLEGAFQALEVCDSNLFSRHCRSEAVGILSFSFKYVSCESTARVVDTQLCKLRDTSAVRTPD